MPPHGEHNIFEEHRAENDPNHEHDESGDIHNADDPVDATAGDIPQFNPDVLGAPKLDAFPSLDAAALGHGDNANPVFADPPSTNPNFEASTLQGNLGKAVEEAAGTAQKEMDLRQGTISTPSKAAKADAKTEEAPGLKARKVDPYRVFNKDDKPGFDPKQWPMFGSGAGSNPDAWSIKRADFLNFIKKYPDPVEGKWAIVDLRDQHNKSDFVAGSSNQLKGALHAPLNENTFRATSKMSFSEQLRNLWATGKRAQTPQEVSERKAAWQKARTEYPFSELEGKNIVFFHCRQSINRTPFMASGYLEYGRPEGSHQKVIIIEGGFDGEGWPAEAYEEWKPVDKQVYW